MNLRSSCLLLDRLSLSMVLMGVLPLEAKSVSSVDLTMVSMVVLSLSLSIRNDSMISIRCSVFLAWMMSCSSLLAVTSSNNCAQGA